MLKGPRVTLRHVTEADLPYLIESSSSAEMRGEFIPTLMRSPHEVRRIFAENGYASEARELLLMQDEKGRVIGNVVHFATRPYATGREIGYMVSDPQARGAGYASEATQLLVDYLFLSLPLNRLEAVINTRNLASQGVARRCGLQLEGTMRGVVFVRGAYQDAQLYGMLRSDWEAMRRGRAA